jgi:hypothetical protein
VEDDPSNVTFGEAYEVYTTRYGREPDLAILHFRKRVAEGYAAAANENEAMTIRLRVEHS